MRRPCSAEKGKESCYVLRSNGECPDGLGLTNRPDGCSGDPANLLDGEFAVIIGRGEGRYYFVGQPGLK